VPLAFAVIETLLFFVTVIVVGNAFNATNAPVLETMLARTIPDTEFTVA